MQNYSKFSAMNWEEEQQYNRLSYDARCEYNRLASKYPSWTHKQIMKKLAFEIEIEDVVNKKGENVNLEDPEIMSWILKGVKSFLQGVGVYIQELFEVIDNILDALTEMIYRGITYIGNRLKDFWDWLIN